MKQFEMTKASVEDEDIENRENIDVNLIEKKPVQPLSSIRKLQSKGILKMPSGRLPLKEADIESYKPTREVEKANKSFEYKSSKPTALTTGAGISDPFRFSSVSAGVKRSILLNQQHEAPQQQLSTKNSSLSVPRGATQTMKFEVKLLLLRSLNDSY